MIGADTRTRELVPFEARPLGCQKNECMYRMENDALTHDVRFIHVGPEEEATFVISAQVMADIHAEIWSEKVRPWLVSLHSVCEGDCDKPHSGCPIWEAYS
mgnify:CR=1 FL=1